MNKQQKQALKIIQEDMEKVAPLEAKVKRLEQQIKALEGRVPFHYPAALGWQKAKPIDEWNEYPTYKWRYEIRQEVLCQVYMADGQEFVFPVHLFHMLSDLPYKAIEDIYHHVKMLKNPD